MVSRPASEPPLAEAPASPQALVEQLLVLATRLAGEQLVAIAQHLSGALLDLTAPDEAKTVYQRVKSGNLLKQNGYAFVHLAVSAVDTALRAEAAMLVPAAGTQDEVLHEALTLVPLSETDSKVAFGVISRPFDIEHAEQLATLNVRLGHLLERDILRGTQNPFRPEVFLAALDAAWCAFEPDASAHALIQPLLRPGLVFDFAPIYDALIKAVKGHGRHGIGADKRQIRKTDDAAASKAARASSQAALAQQLRQFFGDAASAEFAIPLIPDLPDMPNGAGGWRPSAVSGYAVPAATAAAASSAAPAPAPTAPGVGAAPAATPAPGFAAGPQAGTGTPAWTAPAGATMVAAPAHMGPLLAMLAQLPAAAPQAAPTAPAAPAATPGQPSQQPQQPQQPQHPQQAFYLPRLMQSLPEGSLSRGDASTLDLLARIFETVFLDEAIPAPTRELIQSLQMPVLKAALVDKNFFFEEAHPARRMIDLLARMGWDGRTDPDDPLVQAMERTIRRVERDGASQPAVFAEAVAELEASLAQDDSAREAQLAAPVALALRQEHIAVARRAATDAIELRIAGDSIVPVVGVFLEQRWRDVLTLAYDVEEKKPGAVNNATRAMDDLVWSVKPKATQEQRKALIARLPGLLATINKWLDIIKWQDAARLQFFAALAECHAAIVRAPIDLSPVRQLELAVEAAQQDALRLVAQEQAAAALREREADDPVTRTLDGLERGRWLAFMQDDGSVHRLKLAWVSPRRTLFILSAGAREEAFSMQAAQLAERIRAGSATILALDGVVGRVLSAAMRQDAGNDASAADSTGNSAAQAAA